MDAPVVPERLHDQPAATDELRVIAAASSRDAVAQLKSSLEGLTAAEADARRRTFGPNQAARAGPPSVWRELWTRTRNPLNALLLVLAAVSWALSDVRAAVVIFAMVALSIGLGFLQEHRSNLAAAHLADMVRTRASVRRPGSEDFAEVPIDQLVPGDI